MDMQQAKKIAHKKNYGLSSDAEAIITRINERHGQCPCRIDGTACPCPHLAKDVAEHGSCHCGLFLEKERAFAIPQMQGA